MSFLKKLVKGAGSLIGAGVGFMVGGPAGAAAGFSIGGSISSAAAGISSAKQEKKAAKAQQAQARLQAWQQTMTALREYQMAQASAGVGWEASGASLESSGAQGAKSALGSQAATNTALIAQGVQFSNQYYNAMRKISRNDQLAGISNAIGQLGSAAMSVFPRGGTPAPTSAPNPTDTANFGTQAMPIGTTTPTPVYNTIDPYGGP
jgi:hypothetical protein